VSGKRFGQPPGRQAETAQRDERVAAPVREPGIAGQDRPPGAASDEVVVPGSLEGPAKRRTASSLGALQVAPELGDRRWRLGLAFATVEVRRQEEHGRPGDEIEPEDSRRREVLGEVEPAFPLLVVDEVAVPERLVLVLAVRIHRDAGHIRIGPERHAHAAALRVEAERTVLMMERVVVAAGEQGPDVQHGAFGQTRAREPPGESRRRRAS
jgi:hypothetical protein